jgi:hypothetical protein
MPPEGSVSDALIANPHTRDLPGVVDLRLHTPLTLSDFVMRHLPRLWPSELLSADVGPRLNEPHFKDS